MADLIIIGNGFDIAHSIESSYSDFKKYVGSDANLYDWFFSSKYDFWGETESALGNYDEDVICEKCSPGYDIKEVKDLWKYAYQIEDGPDSDFKTIVERFKGLFEDWVDSIDIANAKQVYKGIKKDDIYLTFNYTETLEKVYGVPDSNILHIHGKRGKSAEYVVGHNNPRDSNLIYSEEEGLTPEYTAKSKIIEYMNQLDKDSAGIIQKNKAFFNKLSGVNKIVTYGHSLNEIDWLYFEEVINQTGKEKRWKIHYYSEKDKNDAEKFKKKFGLKKVTLRKP